MADETEPGQYTDPCADHRQWGWQAVGDDHASGPFNSREAAIKDARENTQWTGAKVVVGRVEYPDPAEYCRVNIDDLLRRVEELANDDAWWSDEDTIFDVKGSRDAAQEALEAALAAWAAKWVKAQFWTLRDTTEVTT